MFFKSMELHGFKSFPDKTVLHFDKKITAVIGSNGNGKSNISDALRWVMGEQGAKTLRGDKMEDVIFHGTISRPAMGYAKVALTIDNTDRTLPIDEDEVVICRKLYRTGESEYLLNGKKTRLKDVHNIFMGTGLGRDGYSIVGQGRVAEIVASKPMQRREIFEEAAGVSKFLLKRSEAQKQLANAEENILRQSDIMVELAQRLPSLKKQVEKANEFLVLADKRKGLEVSVSVSEISQLKRQLSETEDKLLVNQAECEHIDKETALIERDIEALAKEKIDCQIIIDEKRTSGSNIQEQISGYKSQIAVLENDILHNQRRIVEIDRQLEASKNGEQEYDEKIALTKEIIAQNNEKIAELEQIIAKSTAELEELTLSRNSEDLQLKELDKQQGSYYIKLSEHKIAITQRENAIKEISEQIKVTENSADENKIKAQLYQGQVAEQKRQLEQYNEELLELNNKSVGYARLVSTKKDKLEAIKTEYEALRKNHSLKSQRLQILRDVENNMEGYQHSVKSIIKAARAGKLSGIHGTAADLISLDEKYAVAIETALGIALQNIIVDNEEVAKRCIGYLKDTNAGRATFLPLTSVKGNVLNQDGLEFESGFEGMGHELVRYDERYRNIIQSLLGRTVIVDDINTATFIAKKYGYRFRIITLDGQIVNAGGSFTGGSTARSGGFFTRKQEIATLEAETDSLATKLKLAEEDDKQITAEYQKFVIEAEGFKEQLTAVKENIIRANSELSRLESLLEQSTNLAENTTVQRERLLNMVQKNETEIAEFTLQIQTLSLQIEQNEALLKEHDEHITVLKETRSALSENISKLSLERMTLIKDTENQQARIAEFENVKKGLLGANDELIKESETLAELINNIYSQIEKIKLEQGKATESLKESSGEIEAGLLKITEIEQKMTQLRQNAKETASHKEKFSKELARQEERKISLQRDYDKIIAVLWENYEMTFSEAKAIAVEITDLPMAQAELQNIKKQISQLGNVNLSSIEEYAEVSERYDFLSGQLADIEKAKAELETLIADLTADIKTKFLNSFNQINHHFTTIFKEIFGGGTARLELSDPDDVLNSGIEIYAAPPGKLIKNLIALSGGEQTMVAATIYFAILRHRPAPFCMFDEVDAALDEINVAKYIGYMRRFSGNTQLMIITHRRLTIEGCDVLYGVFMQEKGVSRLLRQDMAELEEQLIEVN